MIHSVFLENLFTEKERESLYQIIIDEHHRLLSEKFSEYKVSKFTFGIPSNYLTEKLYESFVASSQDLLGSFKISNKNSRQCWANVTRWGDFNEWHNHINTSTINSVYYLSMPDKNSGQIFFRHEKKYFEFQPKEKNLIIFPNYLYHFPTCCKSEEYRIALNMEIICDDNPWK